MRDIAARTGRRAAPLALALALLTLAGCGYKGDLVQAETQDEKAGQVKPEPLPEAED